jgi:glucokinase
MPDLALAVDIGGTRTRSALIARDGRILARTSIATNPRQGMEAGLERMADAVRQVMKDTGREQIAGIGIGAPGPTDPRRGILFSPANLPGWTDVPLTQFFASAIGVPAFAGNDANLAALGEHRFGAGRGAQDMIYLTLSTGIGGGIIADGKLFTGADGFAGEVGHQTIDVNGPRCNCGNIGCLEVLAAGPALARDARAALAAGEKSALLDLAGGDPTAISGETFARALPLGDRLAARLVERAGVYIGVGLVNLIHLFNTRLFVLGGGLTNLGEPLFAPIRQTVAERPFAIMRQQVRIVRAELGDDVGLLGAAALALG